MRYDGYVYSLDKSDNFIGVYLILNIWYYIKVIKYILGSLLW